MIRAMRLRRPVPLAVVGAAPMFSPGDLLGLEDQVVPLAIGHDRQVATLVALVGAVDQPQAHALHVIGLDLHANGGQVFHFDLLEAPHCLDIIATAAEVASKFQADLALSRLVPDDGHRAFRAGKLLPVVEGPFRLAVVDLVEPGERLDVSRGGSGGRPHRGRDGLHVAEPDRTDLLVAASADQEVDALTRAMPVAVVGAAPVLVLGDNGHGVGRAALGEEPRQGKDDRLPIVGLLDLEIDLMALSAGVRDAERKVVAVAVAQPKGNFLDVRLRQQAVAGRLHVSAALGEITVQAEAFLAVVLHRSVDRELACRAGELVAVIEPPAKVFLGGA